jgi:hypothetical protein
LEVSLYGLLFSGKRLNLDYGQVVVHITRNVHNQIGLHILETAISYNRVPSLINFTAEIVSVYALPILNKWLTALSVGNWQKKILLGNVLSGISNEGAAAQDLVSCATPNDARITDL